MRDFMARGNMETTMRYKLYKDESGQWRWRLLAKNGKVIADSAEAYKRRLGCRRSLNLVNMSYDLPVDLCSERSQ